MQYNKLFLIIFLSCLLSIFMITESKAQVYENEPNDCGEYGVKTLFASYPTGTFKGEVYSFPFGGSDLVDYWYIESGTSGTITINKDANFGCEINIISRSTNYCFGTQTFLVSNLISGSKTFSYSSSDFVSIVVENLFSGFINTYTFTISRSELPVELTTFNASVLEHNVELIWETATEVNNYGFEVERKYQESSIKNSDASTSLSMTVIPSGDEGWETLAFVEGHGNSNSPKYYSFTDKSIEASGQYLYRLKQIDIDGTFEYSDQVEVNLGSPNNFELTQNYPNPFNPTTTISYSLPNDARVTLTINDILGNEVAQLENGYKSAGTYSYKFDASNLSSGMYFYTIKAGNFSSTKKMLLMK